MKERVLGRTGLRVSELAMGGLFVSSFGAKFEEAKRAVHRAVDLGINYVDTAPGYGDSEEVLGRILPGIEKPLLLSTKLGGRPTPFNPQDPDALRWSVDESLRLLHRDAIDILMIHEPDRPGQYDWWTSRDPLSGPVLDVLADLKRQGIVKYLGLGGTTAYELSRIMLSERFDVVLTAFNYSLLWREAEHEVLPEAKRLQMGVILGSPLQQGALARMYDLDSQPWLSLPRKRQLRRLYEFASDLGLGLPELSLRFVLSNPDISCALTGSRSEKEVEENVASAQKGPLPTEILAELDEIASMVPFRPFNEPFTLPFNRNYRGPGHA